MGVMLYLILTLRSQFFEDLRDFFVGVLWGIPGIGSLKKKGEKRCLLLRKRLTIVDLFEGLWSVGTRFRRYRQSYFRYRYLYRRRHL